MARVEEYTQKGMTKIAFLNIPSKISVIHMKYRAKTQSFQKYNRSITVL